MSNDQKNANGRPNRSEAEQRVTEVFKRQARLLAALFPRDGETMVNRAIAVARVSVRDPRLSKVAPEIVAERVIACHQLGLEIGDQAYLVPYKQDAQLIIGPRGLVTLMYRSGFVKSVVAQTVCEADVAEGLFDYDLGDAPYIKHKKSLDSRGRDGVLYAYCIVETTTEGKIRNVLTWEDIEGYRAFSKADTGPWFDNWKGMARKTVIKRTAEFVPRSPLLSAALKETELGGYEIPEEVWEQARGREVGRVVSPVDADVAVSASARQEQGQTE